MSLSNSLLSYQDCLDAMDQALADDQGGRVRFPDREAALHFRSRCHYARKLHRDKNAQIYPDPEHPQHGSSHYDELVLKERPDGDGWFIYLVRMKVGSVEVEPLSEVPRIEQQPPPRQLPAPQAIQGITGTTIPSIVETIIKRRI